ncbi:Polysaccharide biosynthesis domain [Dillenia turbinata]|uniref:Polysaccharide biosynthesis domain n=1 Tax=Dillenia turbinata TaxID=194707 RepID=A0AAN8UX67_9MAGN
MKAVNHRHLPRSLGLLAAGLGGLISGALLVSSFNAASTSFAFFKPDAVYPQPTPMQLKAILHYATAKVVPQQSPAEIRLSFDVLVSIAPCNFLVFGLGHDSLMWASLNPRGTTIFLEEDPSWVIGILKNAPSLHARPVKYPTRLSQADSLLSTYKSEPACLPGNASLRGNNRCKLALCDLPHEVYEKEWDVIMIDAPRGYFDDAPGRMGVIYSAAVMARARKKSGVTHVFLHDVNRRVEKAYAEEFLCKKYLVKGVGRLWHFEIPPAKSTDLHATTFC